MRRKAHPHEHEAELNIIPYLDIMVNLVMFMLMSITGFISFQMINVNMPDLSAVSTSEPPPKPSSDNLTLNVSVSKVGFYIAATGGVLPGQAAPGNGQIDEKAPPTIPLKDGQYDYEALTAKMIAIKQRYPSVSQFFLAADRDIKYDVIIQTMDATRGDAQHPLFPDVAFAAVM